VRIACDLRVSDPGAKLAATLRIAAVHGQPFSETEAAAAAALWGGVARKPG